MNTDYNFIVDICPSLPLDQGQVHAEKEIVRKPNDYRPYEA